MGPVESVAVGGASVSPRWSVSEEALTEERQVKAVRLINELLALPEEDDTIVRATKLLAEIRALGVEALPAIRRLLAIKDPVPRVVGIRLWLEIEGGTDAVLQRAADDQSPFVQAEVAAWLLAQNDLGTWAKFLSKMSDALTPHQVGRLFTLLDQDRVTVAMPPGVTVLGWGTPVTTYLAELAAFNAKIFGEVERLTTDRGQTTLRRQQLLGVLGRVNPPGLGDFLQPLITDLTEDINVRWSAVRAYGATMDQVEHLMFLHNWAAAHPRDPLLKAVQQAQSDVEQRLITGAK